MGIVLLLLITVTVILVTPKARTAVLNKCVEVVNERTDWDVDLGRLYLSPFHHSPMILYRAYKGTEDLPLHIEIDSLYVGHRGQDTLIYVHALILEAEKSVLQAESMNCHLGLAIGGHDISPTQALYIKRLGVDVIIGFDAGVGIDCCIEQAQKVKVNNRLWNNRVGYIDMSDVTDKNSPTDQGLQEFNRLLTHKVVWI